jgi:predicted dinucleotide-binding enzyme
MAIGIIGTGKIGSPAARLFVRAGHEVAIANSRGPESLAALADELGGRARAATVDEAAEFGEIVLVAIHFGAYRDLPAAALAGKVVVDAMNYYSARDGRIAALVDETTTSSELLAEHLRDARLVKAFNTMQWESLRDRGDPEGAGERLVIFLAGDDAEAKGRVSELIDAIGFAPVDSGGLSAGGRRQQAGSPVYGRLMTASEVASISA